MEESWKVQNNTGGILVLKKDSIVIKNPREIIDLVSVTGKSVRELETDSEIRLHLSYNNIVTIEKIQPDPKDKVLSDKIDGLMTLLSGMKDTKAIEVVRETVSMDGVLDEISETIREQLGKIKIDGQSSVLETKEEEKMREDAMKKLVEKTAAPDKNFENLGSEKKIKNDGFEDLVDF